MEKLKSENLKLFLNIELELRAKEKNSIVIISVSAVSLKKLIITRYSKIKALSLCKKFLYEKINRYK